jgi:hypothetical protein
MFPYSVISRFCWSRELGVVEKGLEERGSRVFIHSCKTLYLCENRCAWSHIAVRVQFSILEIVEKELTAP